MRIDVWSDIVCPWCAIGRSRLERAVAAYRESGGEAVEIRWRSFELDPRSPRSTAGDHAELLSRKYGFGIEQARQMLAQMVERGAGDGVVFDFARIQHGNTFDAHRLLHLAERHGLQDALKGRMFRAYFAEGAAVGDADAMGALAVEVGVPESEVREVLASDRFAEAVRGDESLARQLGVTGVPFFVFDERVAVSGAQPVELLTRALRHAEETREPEALGDAAEACGPDGCPI
ncbi:MAG: DsbA family oxidoreductase [Alphaproteobacteria bacterium]|nr:DsbA family oxidoreductase [Alphaproteobacteria bacterium]